MIFEESPDLQVNPKISTRISSYIQIYDNLFDFGLSNTSLDILHDRVNGFIDLNVLVRWIHRNLILKSNFDRSLHFHAINNR